ncbi:MAG: adenylate/guanylate cyclase domain-containing protein [Magnetococcales bacterium]|nr:adenylate/guanylate cyclase domain-containing protein [Magnetococcales bacterium]
MSRLSWIRTLTGLAATLLFALHTLGLLPVPPLTRLEQAGYDLRVRINLPNSHDTRIVIVDIDEKSLARLGRWPWGRQHLAQLTDTLFDHYRILTLGFDVLFTERDDSSGLMQLERLAAGPMRNQPAFLFELNRLRPSLERDERFAKSLAGRSVILGHYFRSDGSSPSSQAGTLPEPLITLDELGVRGLSLVKPTGYGANLEILRKAALGGGFLDNPLVDTDGVHRAIPLVQEYQGELHQSFALGVVRAILGDPPVTLGLRSAGFGSRRDDPLLEWIGLGPHRIPVDGHGAILIPYRVGPNGFIHLSALDVLEKSLPVESLNDAIVLVGSAIPGMMDLHATPLHPFHPGVEIHATVIGGILDGVIKRQPEPLATLLTVAQMVLIAGIFGLLMPRLAPWRVLQVTGIILILLTWSNALLWRRADLILPLAAPLLFTLLLLALHLGVLFGSARAWGARPNRLLADHLPGARLAQIDWARIESTLHGMQREISVLFVNIRDFPALTVHLSPRELKQLLDPYLTRMIRAIHAHHGTLDHFTGDVVMGFWGAPEENPRHARDALRCALAMQRAVGELNDELQAKGLPTLTISIGIQTGEAHVGELASGFRSVYGAVGATVEQARRLELLGKRYGVTVTVGDATRRAVPEGVFRQLDRIRSRLATAPMEIFEPLGFADDLADEIIDALEGYHEALRLYRIGDWEEARVRFRLLMERDPERSIHELYLSRIHHLLAHPPAAAWDGVFPPRA